MSIRSISFLLVTAIFLMGCGEYKIEGEIFVNNNGATKILSGIKIGIVEESSLVEAVDLYKKNAEQNLQNLYDKNSKNQIVKKYGNVFEEIIKNLNESEEWYKSLDAALLPKAQKLQLALSDKVSKNTKFLENLVSKAKSGKDSKNYDIFSTISYLAIAESNSQGKYSINVPKSQRPILIASDGDHLWAIDISKKDSAINLNNSNEFGSECGNCFFAQDSGQKIIANVADSLKEVDRKNSEKKLEMMSEKYVNLLSRSQKIISICKGISARHSKLIVDNAYNQAAPDTTAGIQRATEIQNKFLQLRVDVINLQGEHKNLTNLVIEELEKLNGI